MALTGAELRADYTRRFGGTVESALQNPREYYKIPRPDIHAWLTAHPEVYTEIQRPPPLSVGASGQILSRGEVVGYSYRYQPEKVSRQTYKYTDPTGKSVYYYRGQQVTESQYYPLIQQEAQLAAEQKQVPLYTTQYYKPAAYDPNVRWTEQGGMTMIPQREIDLRRAREQFQTSVKWQRELQSQRQLESRAFMQFEAEMPFFQRLASEFVFVSRLENFAGWTSYGAALTARLRSDTQEQEAGLRAFWDVKSEFYRKQLRDQEGFIADYARDWGIYALMGSGAFAPITAPIFKGLMLLQTGAFIRQPTLEKAIPLVGVAGSALLLGAGQLAMQRYMPAKTTTTFDTKLEKADKFVVAEETYTSIDYPASARARTIKYTEPVSEGELANAFLVQTEQAGITSRVVVTAEGEYINPAAFSADIPYEFYFEGRGFLTLGGYYRPDAMTSPTIDIAREGLTAFGKIPDGTYNLQTDVLKFKGSLPEGVIAKTTIIGVRVPKQVHDVFLPSGKSTMKTFDVPQAKKDPKLFDFLNIRDATHTNVLIDPKTGGISTASFELALKTAPYRVEAGERFVTHVTQTDVSSQYWRGTDFFAMSAPPSIVSDVSQRQVLLQADKPMVNQANVILSASVNMQYQTRVPAQLMLTRTDIRTDLMRDQFTFQSQQVNQMQKQVQAQKQYQVQKQASYPVPKMARQDFRPPKPPPIYLPQQIKVSYPMMKEPKKKMVKVYVPKSKMPRAKLLPRAGLLSLGREMSEGIARGEWKYPTSPPPTKKVKKSFFRQFRLSPLAMEFPTGKMYSEGRQLEIGAGLMPNIKNVMPRGVDMRMKYKRKRKKKKRKR